MDETIQDSIVATPQLIARNDDARHDSNSRPTGSPDPLGGSTRVFLTTIARSPTERADAFWQWNLARIEHDVLPFGKALMEPPKPTTALRYLGGSTRSGLNFSSQE